MQNRCYAVQGRRIREFCTANEIVYQGFSLDVFDFQLEREEVERTERLAVR